MSYFNSLVQRVGYGAIMYNGSSTGIVSCYPFFTSRPNLTALTSISSSGAGTISINDVDDYWTVMPGYKLEVYNNAFYGSLLLTGDNTNGVVPINYVISANQASSIKLYFNSLARAYAYESFLPIITAIEFLNSILPAAPITIGFCTTT